MVANWAPSRGSRFGEVELSESCGGARVYRRGAVKLRAVELWVRVSGDPAVRAPPQISNAYKSSHSKS